MKTPVIKTDGVTLRGFESSDVNRLAEILSDPVVMRYMPGSRPWPREAAEREIGKIIEHWNERGYGRWAVIYGDDLIGWCGIEHLKELGETEVAYLLDKEYWNRGIATKAAERSLDFGFENVGLGRIIALAFPENIASRRVMEKIGMVFEKMTHIWNLDLVQYQIGLETFRRKKGEVSPENPE